MSMIPFGMGGAGGAGGFVPGTPNINFFFGGEMPQTMPWEETVAKVSADAAMGPELAKAAQSGYAPPRAIDLYPPQEAVDMGQGTVATNPTTPTQVGSGGEMQPQPAVEDITAKPVNQYEATAKDNLNANPKKAEIFNQLEKMIGSQAGGGKATATQGSAEVFDQLEKMMGNQPGGYKATPGSKIAPGNKENPLDPTGGLFGGKMNIENLMMVMMLMGMIKDAFRD